MVIQLSLLGKGRVGGHGHTEPSFQKLSCSAGKGKGWWSWSYSLLFWEREEVVVIVMKSLVLKSSPLLRKGRVVVMVIQSLILQSSPLLGKGRGGGHGHTEPPSAKLSFARWWSWSSNTTRTPSQTSWRWTTMAGAPTTIRTTTPSLSQKRREALQRKDVYDHDHHPFHFPEEEERPSREGCA